MTLDFVSVCDPNNVRKRTLERVNTKKYSRSTNAQHTLPYHLIYKSLTTDSYTPVYIFISVHDIRQRTVYFNILHTHISRHHAQIIQQQF